MIFLALLFIGFALVYIGKAMSELTDLVYMLSSEMGDDEGGEEPGPPKVADPGPPDLQLHTLDDILGDLEQ